MASGRYEIIAERYLNVKLSSSSEWMTECPFCNGASSLQFNIDTGLWLCFRCDEKGNAKRLVQRLGGTYADPAVSVEHIRQHMDRIRIRAKKAKQRQPVLPDSVLARYDFPDPYWTEDRGFSADTIQKFRLGYDPISDRHTIPYRTVDGDLLGVIQRLKGDVFPRYIYPENFDRKNSLFGSWLIKEPKAAIVEGSTDVIALADVSIPALAQYGSSITRNQVRLLHRLGIRELVLFYDYDEAGRKAVEKARENIEGIILREVTYDPERYCWHKKLCTCGYHTWRTIGKCEAKKLCTCGRKHEMDPGSLKKKERKSMYENAVLVGSKQWKR